MTLGPSCQNSTIFENIQPQICSKSKNDDFSKRSQIAGVIFIYLLKKEGAFFHTLQSRIRDSQTCDLVILWSKPAAGVGAGTSLQWAKLGLRGSLAPKLTLKILCPQKSTWTLLSAAHLLKSTRSNKSTPQPDKSETNQTIYGQKL